MTKSSINFRLLFIGLLLVLMFANCGKSVSSQPSDTTPPADSTIIIPKGDVTVACYYFPNWGPFLTSEWKYIKFATPKFPGHLQPKFPMWGYENENDPAVMSKKIDSASYYGINTFIFDWYYSDNGSYLEKALEQGFLGASNNNKMKFALMWCTNDLTSDGPVKPETFDKVTDYVIEHYFKQPSYWKIDGCPYFSIYRFDTFLKTFNNDTIAAFNALQRFRAKVKTAGFPDLHLNGIITGLAGDQRNNIILRLNINSTTSYGWDENYLPKFPTSDYLQVSDLYFEAVNTGGAYNGLETPVNTIPVPYYPVAQMGWDATPRAGPVTASDWMTHVPHEYAYGPVVINNTPYNFKKVLVKVKEFVLNKPEKDRIIFLNSWNEWGEGSYLEPDMINGMKYLEAIKTVFK